MIGFKEASPRFGVPSATLSTFCRFHAAQQEGAQLPFREPGDMAIPVVLPCQKGLELRGDHTIKNAFFRITRGIKRGGFANSKILPERHEIAALVSNLLRDRGHRTQAGQLPRSPCCCLTIRYPLGRRFAGIIML